MSNRYSGLFELAAWTGGLLYLGWLNPASPPPSICPLKFAGFEYCPGCGLGTSIAYLFDGNVSASLDAHPLGLFAAGVLVARIVTLMKPIFSLIITHSKGYTHA